MKIIARDGKELDVDLTLEMTRQALDTWLEPVHQGGKPIDPDAARGLGLALEAALLKLQEQERRTRRRRMLG